LCVPGGVNQNLDLKHRDALRRDIDQIIGWCGEALVMHQRLVHSQAQLYQTFPNIRSSYVSLVGPEKEMELYDGVLRAIDSNGTSIFEAMEARD
jgi:NAD-reducing hydrogenase large subunit